MLGKFSLGVSRLHVEVETPQIRQLVFEMDRSSISLLKSSKNIDEFNLSLVDRGGR